MNKLIFLFTALIFISCESEDSADDSNNSSNSDSSVLVKTITTTTNDGDYSNVITEEYFYEGNKIERKLEYRSGSDYSNSNEVYRTYNYTYTNNNISNVKRYDSNDELEREYIFNYDSNGKLISYSNEHFTYGEKILYTLDYDGNYILACETVIYDDVVNYNYYTKYTINSNSDLTFMESVQSCSFSAPLLPSDDDDFGTANVEYDNNPSPFKNVEGNNFILTTEILTYADLLGYYNNVTKVTFNGGDGTYSILLTYDYNSDNYPRNVQISEEDGQVYLYESVDIDYY